VPEVWGAWMTVNSDLSSQTVTLGSGNKTLVEAAYEALRQEIIAGNFAPGAKLRTEELRLRYKMGASTLREALTRLLGEALVTTEGQRGFRVAQISLDDFRDLTEVRKLIETQALRQSITMGDEAWESNVVAAHYRLSKTEERLTEDPEGHTAQFEERNRDFHLALIAACPSRWLHQIYGMLYHQSERYRRLSVAKRSVPRDVHAEHKAIFDATIERDRDRACQLLEEHIDRTLDVLRQSFAVQDGAEGKGRSHAKPADSEPPRPKRTSKAKAKTAEA
jgi:GntR family transcriptional regulator, carbon starvation induced regulator